MASKYTRSARGQSCQVRLPGVCNHDTSTVVFAHLNGGGMEMKMPDICGAYACSACHDMIDGRTHDRRYDFLEVRAAHLEGMQRTIQIMIRDGVLVL